MLTCKEWVKGKTCRVYLSPSKGNAYLSLSARGRCIVTSAVPAEIPDLTEQLTQGGIDFAAAYDWGSLTSITNRFTAARAGQTHTSAYAPKSSTPRKASKAAIPVASGMAALCRDASNHHCKDIKLKASTLKQVVTLVDTREPDNVMSEFSAGQLPCTGQTLPVGDIHFVNETAKTLLVIERKTVTDLYQSIVSARAHHQAERLFAFAQQKREQGWRVMVCWFVVCQDGRGLYDVLPQTKQMDGMLNYLTAILDQHVFQVFHEQHGAYLATKLAQGFNERQLTYPVKTGSGERVDLPASFRALPVKHTETEGSDHNVRLAEQDQLLYVLTAFKSINIRVAKALSATGKSLRAILSMSQEELELVEGIGKTLASRIYKEFSI